MPSLLNIKQRRYFDTLIDRSVVNTATPIMNLLFPPSTRQGTTEPFITYDQLQGDTGMLPFNMQGGEAQMLQGRGFDGRGVQLPEINVVRPISGQDLLTRGPGQVLFTTSAEAQTMRNRYLQEFNTAITDLNNGLTMRKEWMACQILRGEIAYSNDKVNFNIPLDRPSANNLTASTFWDQANASPVEDIMAMKSLASSSKVIRPTIAIVGNEAAREIEALVLAKELVFDKENDVTIGNLRSFTSAFEDSEMHYMGRICGIPFWEYSRQETDIWTGTTVDFIRPKYIEFFNTQGSTIAANKYFYGAIPRIDETNGANPQIYSDMREVIFDIEANKNPVGVQVFLKSRPLMITKNPDSYFSMKVISG